VRTARRHDGNDPDQDDPPSEWYRVQRRLLHHFMRLAYQAGEDHLVEVLEPHRELASAQTAYALADYEERRALSSRLS
jgi:hypothetical protein